MTNSLEEKVQLCVTPQELQVLNCYVVAGMAVLNRNAGPLGKLSIDIGRIWIGTQPKGPESAVVRLEEKVLQLLKVEAGFLINGELTK